MTEKVVIGNAELWHGDCREVLPLLPKHDLLLTDPPYGIGESSRKNITRGKPFGSRVDAKNTRGTYVAPTDYGEYEWDNERPNDVLVAMMISSANYAIVWGGNYFGLPAASKWLVWDKLNSGDFADCELAWTNLPGAVRIFRHMWNGMLRDSERDSPRVHPTQKPIALAAWCMAQPITADTRTVLDPFMGSGTVGVACAHFQKAFTGIERERRYFDIACERISRAQAQGRMFEPEPIKQEQEPLL